MAFADIRYEASEGVCTVTLHRPEKLNAVTTADVCRAATRLFRGAPTLATMGPAQRVPALAEISERLAA